MRRHPRRTQVDPLRPRAWGTSDKNGFIGQHGDLVWQWEWAGFELINLHFLAFPEEIDEPNRQLGAIFIPPDPDPILDARPEQYTFEETPVSTIAASPQQQAFIITYPGTQLYSLLVAT